MDLPASAFDCPCFPELSKGRYITYTLINFCSSGNRSENPPQTFFFTLGRVVSPLLRFCGQENGEKDSVPANRTESMRL